MTERRMFFCEKCQKEWMANPRQNSVLRELQKPGEPEPRCPAHGKMTLQANVAYRGSKHAR